MAADMADPDAEDMVLVIVAVPLEIADVAALAPPAALLAPAAAADDGQVAPEGNFTCTLI